MNPYDFVPVDFKRSIERRGPAGHDRFSGLSGEIFCSMVAETPVFLKGRDAGSISQFLMNSNKDYVVPASSLKGLMRSLVETVGHGCFGGMFDGLYEKKSVNHNKYLPSSFKNCTKLTHLCIGCRLFGWLTDSAVYTGKVLFTDATCPNEGAVVHKPVYTVDLMGPKPRHEAFYINGNYIAGRKFYFHFPQGIATKNEKSDYNAHIKPLDIGSAFNFKVQFTNLDEDELPFLLYVLTLDENMRHKIGYAKPSGFGSVKIKIESLTLNQTINRYLKGKDQEASYSADKNAEGLKKYVFDITKKIKEDKSTTMEKLREIWNWDPKCETSYRYPDYHWFQNTANRYKTVADTFNET